MVSTGVATLILGLLSLVAYGVKTAVDVNQNKKQTEQQIQHDKEMAEISKQNDLDVMHQEFDMKNNFNSFANSRGQMAEAGLNPALMYGGMSGPVVNDASAGSPSAKSSSLPSPFRMPDSPFGSIDPASIANLGIARMNAESMRKNAEANATLASARSIESATRAEQNTYDLGLKKALRTNIIDTATANLHKIQADTENVRSEHLRRDILLPGEWLMQDKQLKTLQNQIDREPYIREQLSSDIKRLDSMTALNKEQALTEGSKRSQLSAQADLLKESLHGTQLDRIMTECGISSRHTNLLRNGDLQPSEFKDSEYRAYNLLLDNGFSDYEAASAVLFYSGVEPKDLVPSVINGASRILGSLAPSFSYKIK